MPDAGVLPQRPTAPAARPPGGADDGVVFDDTAPLPAVIRQPRSRINDIWLPGLDRARPVADGRDNFDAMCVGWYCDGQTIHDDFIRMAAPAEMAAAAGAFRMCNTNLK